MSNNVFIPDNDNKFALIGLRRGTIHYNFKTAKYQDVSHSSRHKLIHKLERSLNWDIEKNILPTDEEIEFKKLFDKINETPNEYIIQNCILVVISRVKYKEKLAIGLEVIDGNNYVAFKSVNVSEIKRMCKKYQVTLNYDRKFNYFLLTNAYLNEIIPEKIWEYTALKYINIKKRNKTFSRKLQQLFGL